MPAVMIVQSAAQKEKIMRFDEVNRTASDDSYGSWEIDDTRRPKMTLKHLNKMRNMRAMAQAEHQEQVAQWRSMYATGSSE